MDKNNQFEPSEDLKKILNEAFDSLENTKAFLEKAYNDSSLGYSMIAIVNDEGVHESMNIKEAIDVMGIDCLAEKLYENKSNISHNMINPEIIDDIFSRFNKGEPITEQEQHLLEVLMNQFVNDDISVEACNFGLGKEIMSALLKQQKKYPFANYIAHLIASFDSLLTLAFITSYDKLNDKDPSIIEDMIIKQNESITYNNKCDDVIKVLALFKEIQKIFTSSETLDKMKFNMEEICGVLDIEDFNKKENIHKDSKLNEKVVPIESARDRMKKNR